MCSLLVHDSIGLRNITQDSVSDNGDVCRQTCVLLLLALACSTFHTYALLIIVHTQPVMYADVMCLLLPPLPDEEELCYTIEEAVNRIGFGFFQVIVTFFTGLLWVSRAIYTGRKAYDGGIGRTPIAVKNLLYLFCPATVCVRIGNI